jgi:hypothetical protein
VLTILAVLLVFFLGLAGLFWAGSIFVQGYIYESPSFSSLAWRSPAAAGAVTLVLFFWCWLDYKDASPERAELPYDTLFRFSARENEPPKPFPKFTSIKNKKETVYERKATGKGTTADYVNPQNNQRWSRSDAEGIVDKIIIGEGDQKTTYKVDLPPGGKFKQGEPARYVEEGGRGRVLTEEDLRLGQVSVFRMGRFIANLFLNFFLGAVLFAGIWLLLRYQWKHALGLAVVLWIAMLFLIVPMVLGVVSDQGAKKTPAGATTTSFGGPPQAGAAVAPA